jgi:hypothetical protein
MDHYRQKVLPFLQDGRPGHLWTGRLELLGLIETLDDWMFEHGMDFEAASLRADFKAMPAANYTVPQCLTALKQETAKWRAR